MCAGVCVASHDKSTLGNVAAGGGKSEVMALPPLVLAWLAAGCWQRTVAVEGP
jgi:hypothetical protein